MGGKARHKVQLTQRGCVRKAWDCVGEGNSVKQGGKAIHWVEMEKRPFQASLASLLSGTAGLTPSSYPVCPIAPQLQFSLSLFCPQAHRYVCSVHRPTEMGPESSLHLSVTRVWNNNSPSATHVLFRGNRDLIGRSLSRILAGIGGFALLHSFLDFSLRPHLDTLTSQLDDHPLGMPGVTSAGISRGISEKQLSGKK